MHFLSHNFISVFYFWIFILFNCFSAFCPLSFKGMSSFNCLVKKFFQYDHSWLFQSQNDSLILYLTCEVSFAMFIPTWVAAYWSASPQPRCKSTCYSPSHPAGGAVVLASASWLDGSQTSGKSLEILGGVTMRGTRGGLQSTSLPGSLDVCSCKSSQNV